VDPLQLGVGGGDDYELALTVPADRIDALVNAVAPTRVTHIGEIVSDGQAVLDHGDGSVEPLSALGWDHFEEQP